MSDDEEPKPIVVTLALAREGNEEVHNEPITFAMSAKPDKKVTVALFARELLEEAAAQVFLSKICNRALTPDSVTTTAVELIYGAGVRTVIQRNALKSVRKINVRLSLGTASSDPSKLPILLPDENLYVMVAHRFSKDEAPVLYLRTSLSPIAPGPATPKFQSTLGVSVDGAKKGYWIGELTVADKRSAYPKELPVRASRKRKKKEDDDEGDGKDAKKGKPLTKAEEKVLAKAFEAEKSEDENNEDEDDEEAPKEEDNNNDEGDDEDDEEDDDEPKEEDEDEDNKDDEDEDEDEEEVIKKEVKETKKSPSTKKTKSKTEEKKSASKRSAKKKEAKEEEKEADKEDEKPKSKKRATKAEAKAKKTSKKTPTKKK